MAEFFVTLSDEAIARQVAELLNAHNKLTVKHNQASIANSPTRYFVELEGDRVIGCTGLVKEYPTLSKSFHTCVVPEARGKGLGKKLLMIAMKYCETENIYGTVRQDNLASLRMLNSLGFVFVKKEWKNDHFIYVMGRKVKNG